MDIKSIMYVAPRFHTNQVPIVRYLLGNGIKVKYLVERIEPTEDTSLLTPEVCKGNFIYNIIENYICKNKPAVWREDYRLHHFIPSFRHLFKIISSSNPDVLIYREPNIFSFFTNWIARMLGVRNRIMYIQSPCYHVNNSIQRKYLLKLRNLLFSSKVYSPVLKSNSSLRDDELYKQDIMFIPFIMDFPTSYIKRNYLKDGKIRILDVGKFRDYKNHYVLVDAIAHLSKYYRDQLEISIVGQCVKDEELDYFDSLQKYIKKKSLEGKIHLIKNYPFNKMNGLYFQNDIFILTSKKELASIAVLEAMSKGLVSISSDNNGTATYIPEHLGYKFKTNCATDLSLIIKQIIDNKENIKKMGYETFRFSKKNYSPEVYYRKLVELVKL